MLSSRFLLALSLALAAGCTNAADVGQACADTSDCIGGLSCIEHEGAELSPVCMADCTLSTTRLCEGGAVCTAVGTVGRPPDLGVCYLGGTTAIGEECVGNLECARGAICVAVAGSPQRCYQACSTDDDEGCGGTETCSAITGGGTAGFCVPAP